MTRVKCSNHLTQSPSSLWLSVLTEITFGTINCLHHRCPYLPFPNDTPVLSPSLVNMNAHSATTSFLSPVSPLFTPLIDFASRRSPYSNTSFSFLLVMTITFTVVTGV